ncbi:MAG: hypothetical protein ACE5G2_12960 [Candidatus Krumholzibacteriia bacterium]
MGTFHDDKGELHGITVVVDTNGPQVFVGRCDTMDAQQIVLLDADVHEDGTEGRSKDDFVHQAARFGHWKKHDRVVIPASDIASVRRLGQVPVE